MAIGDFDRLEDLYENFKKMLKKHPDSLYLDEDDLLDIFDYAGDVNDDHVRLEALMLGYKLFPDSFDLLKRRAIFMADCNETSFGQLLTYNDSVAPDDFMWEILHCRAFGRASDIVDRLESLLKKFTLEEDEEIIQFVNIVHQFGQEKWLVDNLDRIKQRCAYPTTLMYELARTAESPEQMQIGVKLLEQLTEEDAFNPDYWGLLADVQTALGNYDEALVSLDYAKALTPENADLFALQGYIELHGNKPEKAVKSLQKAYNLSDNPSLPTIKNLIEAYHQSDQYDKILPYAKELFEANVTDSEAFMDVLSLSTDDADITLERFHSAPSEHDETATMQRIAELCASGRSKTALKYLQWYGKRYELSQSAKLAMVELLYSQQDYQSALKYLDDNFSGLNLTPTELPYVGLIVSTMLKTYQFQAAKQFAILWIENLNGLETGNYLISLVKKGLIDSLKRIISALSKGNGTLTDSEIEELSV